MRANVYRKMLLALIMGTGSLLLWSECVSGQSIPRTDALAATSPAAAPLDETAEVRALVESVRALQAQVQALNLQVSELREEQQRGRAQAADSRPERVRGENLSPELSRIGPQGTTSGTGSGYPGPTNDSGAAGASPQRTPSGQQNLSASTPNAGPQAIGDRIDKIEEEQQFIDAKVNDQYQTKVESGSKYRLRLSGMVLLNLYDTRGAVDNQDFPEISTPLDRLDSRSAFGGTLRQSQIGLDVFGPDIAGAHTSANVKFDFAGGFPSTENGVSQGLVRLRTGVIRFDWNTTSVVAGQDRLFFAPLAPTSLATLAIPALSYAGNLWNWTPQIRIEHRHNLSENSNLLFQAGILDSLSGDVPSPTPDRQPTWGEASGQPAYAARVAWTRRVSGQNLAVGFGGYYGRQDWGLNRTVDGWAATMDAAVPLGKWFALTGAFYRGRALGGLSGAIGQDVVMSGRLTDPTTVVLGLNSMGGWIQLKFKPRPKLELNGAFGDDNPFASDLRRFSPTGSFYGVWLSKNLSPFVNVIYQLRSDVVIAIEFRRLQTFVLNTGSTAANHVNLSVGYTF